MRLLDAMRASVWPGTLAALAIVGLLLAFHQVVRGAVEQGELRRKATAMQAEAIWRCNALRGPLGRDDCLLQVAQAGR